MERKLMFSLNLPNTKRGTSRKKRHEELLKKLHKFCSLCGSEIASVFYRDCHSKPVIFSNHENNVKTFTKFRELSTSMKSKNQVAQDEYNEQSIIKMLEEEILNLIKESLIEKTTTEMNEVLKEKEDVTIKMNPYDVNDLAEHTELSIKKLEEESQKQIEENIIEELITKMNEVLKGKEDVTIETNPYDVNDLVEYTEMSIKKLEEEIQKQIEQNLVQELTTKMNDVLKTKKKMLLLRQFLMMSTIFCT
ncbi:hypothetical protein T459_27267 [Capsicum annuum]|uniref:Uncharacterized protein n=1 Tax=Capsicum annuum TaxID=4072 RepID=A0A1U8EGZ6_CAPAN|nr:hypothetical protein FXO37_35333 [Capsicum annuum]PHT67780.1 hypothetical protein T459_27267 [Capsicum annuum]